MNLRPIGRGLVALALLLPSFVHAQGVPMFQSGTVVPNHLMKGAGNGLQMDVGGLFGDANGRGTSPFSITDAFGLGLCSNTAVTGGQHYAFCLGHDATGNALLSVTANGGALDKSMFLSKNGVLYEIPFVGAGSGNVVGPSPSTLDAISCWNNTAGTLLKNCGTIATRNYWSNTITGDIGAALAGGVEIATASNGASSLTGIGKINGLYAHHTFGGSAGEGQRAAIFGHLTQNGTSTYTSSSYAYNTAVWGWTQVLQGNTAVGTEGNYFGFAGLVEVGGTTRAKDINSFEGDCNIGATATAGNRICIIASIGGGTFASPTRATDYDGAFAIGRASSIDASFKAGFMLRGPNGVWPLADDSTGFGGLGTSNDAVPLGSPAVPAELGNGMDMSGIAFTFQQYVSDNFQIDADGNLFIFNTSPQIKMRATGVAVTAGGLVRLDSEGAGTWAFKINTAAGGDFSTGINAISISATGGVGFGAEIKLAGIVVGSLPTCNGGTQGSTYMVTDAAATPVYNAVVANGGSVRVLAFCDGANWRNH